MIHQPVAHFHNFGSRHRQPGPLRQTRRQHLIRQHPQMLRIIPKLHHVELPIGAAHQMPLRPSPHPSHVLDCFHQAIWRGHSCPRKLRKGDTLPLLQSPPSYINFAHSDVTNDLHSRYQKRNHSWQMPRLMPNRLSHSLAHPPTTRLATPSILFPPPPPAPPRRTASAIAIAITQSSCAPSAAAAFPSGRRTNVRHSSSNRGLEKNCGSAVNTAAMFSIIAGRLAADVSQPNWLSFSKMFSYSMSRRCASTPYPWLFRSTANIAHP